MSDAEDVQGQQAPYTITLKNGAGFDSSWLVVRAESAEDAVALLAEAKLAELPSKIAEFALDFQEAGGTEEKDAKDEKPAGRGGSRGSSSRGGSRGGSSKQQSSARSGAGDDIAEEDLHPEGLTCDKRGCDGRVHYKNIDSRGKHYELWVCEFQRSKGDGHFSEFIN